MQNKQQAGMTLAELSVVLIMLSALFFVGTVAIAPRINQAEKEALEITLSNIAGQVQNYATVLQVASNTGTNKFGTTLTLSDYNLLVDQAGLDNSYKINTVITLSPTIKLLFGSNGFIKVFTTDKTLQIPPKHNRMHHIRAMTKRIRNENVNYSY